MNARAVQGKGAAPAKKLTKAQREALASRRTNKARAQITLGAPMLSIPAAALYVNRGARAFCYLRVKDQSFPKPVSPNGRPMFRRADLDSWLAKLPTVDEPNVEPAHLARANGHTGQVHRIAEPRTRRATDKPAAARKATRQTARPGV